MSSAHDTIKRPSALTEIAFTVSLWASKTAVHWPVVRSQSLHHCRGVICKLAGTHSRSLVVFAIHCLPQVQPCTGLLSCPTACTTMEEELILVCCFWCAWKRTPRRQLCTCPTPNPTPVATTEVSVSGAF
eukprot:1157725-Pelagomonas_calceolata.AAC.4